MKLKRHLDLLKKLTSKRTQSFPMLADYFFGNIIDTSEGMKASTLYTSSSDFYDKVVTPILIAETPGAEIVAKLLHRIDFAHFVHGILMRSTGIPITLYYFDDIHTGLAITQAPGTDQINYYRLSGICINPVNSLPLMGAKSSSAVH